VDLEKDGPRQREVVARLAGGIADMFIRHANNRPDDQQAQQAANEATDRAAAVRRELLDES
jgi:hypothetical protein